MQGRGVEWGMSEMTELKEPIDDLILKWERRIKVWKRRAELNFENLVGEGDSPIGGVCVWEDKADALILAVKDLRKLRKSL